MRPAQSLLPPADAVTPEGDPPPPPDAIDREFEAWCVEDLVHGVDPAVIEKRKADWAQGAIADAAFKEAEFAKLRAWLSWLHADDGSAEPDL